MDANCTVMVELSSSSFLFTSLAFNLCTASAAIPILTWASAKLWRGVHPQKFDNNLRILIQTHLLGFILHCYARVVLHSMDLYNYTSRTPCDMVPNIYRCFVFRLIYNTGMWMTTCSAVTIVIERCVATFLREKYEKLNIWFGILLAILQLGIAAVPLSFAYSNTKFDGVFMPYCSVYKPGHPDIALANSVAAIVAQFGARCLFGVLFRVNKNLRETLLSSSLSTRFQLEQNKLSMQCLKIYANLSTIYLFSQTSSFMYLIEKSSNIPKQHYLALMEFNIQLPLYGILSVVLVARKIHSEYYKVQVDLENHMKRGTIEYHIDFEKMVEGPVRNEKRREAVAKA